MAKNIKSIPEGYHSVNIFIMMKEASKAIQFYKKAFGAQEKSRFNMPDGKIMFAELQIGNSTLQLADEFPNHEYGLVSPKSLNTTNCIIHLYVDDADSVFESAVKVGAQVIKEPENMFWGDRYGQIIDPFGYIWSIATRIENVTSEQLDKRVRELLSQS